MQLALPTVGRASSVAAQVADSIGANFSAKALAENFDVLVNAAGSTKLLKELVLQLAVRGRLLPDGGESAQSLVSQIAQQRTRLDKQGVRLRDDLTLVASDEIPYEVPTGWRWIRLGHLGGFLGGGTPSKSNTAFWRGPLPWVSPKDMKRPYIDDAEDHISMSAVEQSSAKLIPPKSVLFVLRGMILAHSFPVAVTTRQVTINQDMRALVLAVPDLNEFILRTMQAARGRVLAMVERSSHGTCRLDSERVEMLPIALPPIAEQKRIVAKVDQLMALCDELEARQTKKRETGTRLTKSALEALTTAETPEDFNRAWTRVSENFETIVDGLDSPKALKAAVLQLGISGKLLRSEGHTADPLVARLRRSRVQMEADGVRVRQYSPITDDEIPHAVPDGWRWIRLGELGAFLGGGTPSKANPAFWRGEIPWVSPKDMKRPYIDDAEDHISAAAVKGSAVKMIPSSSLLFVVRGMILAHSFPVALTRREVTVNQDMKALTLAEPEMAEFVLRLLQSIRPRVLAMVETSSHGTCRLDFERVANLPIALPPLEEQILVTAKIDQLLELCDHLWSRTERARDLASAVATALAATVTGGG